MEEMDFKYKNKNRLKVRKEKNIHQPNSQHKKTGQAILILDYIVKEYSQRQIGTFHNDKRANH